MTEPDEPLTAGIVSRGVAAVIDLVVVGAVIGLLYLGLVLSRLIFNPTAFTLPALNALFSTTAVLVMSALYLAGAWAVSGCTVGAVVMGLRVVGQSSRADSSAGGNRARRRVCAVSGRPAVGRRRSSEAVRPGHRARHPRRLRAAVVPIYANAKSSSVSASMSTFSRMSVSLRSS